MSKSARTTASAIALALALTNAAASQEFREQVVKTHPSQGKVTVVANAVSRISADRNGIYVSLKSSAFAPGHVHTLWLVSINNPAGCESRPCSSKDVLKRSAIVRSDVGYAGGIVAGPDGSGSLSAYQPIGAIPGGWFGTGLLNPTASEIHLVVNDHGPAIEGRLGEMLTTYRGGCTDESIPAPMPDVARAQGMPGPNTCRLVQFSIFEPSRQ